jgi:hypothetical protein
MAARASEYFNNMGSGYPSELYTQWEQDITSAESQRMSNPAAMDILGASAQPAGRAPTKTSFSDNSAVEEWIQSAIDLEKMQCVVVICSLSGYSCRFVDLMFKIGQGG